MLTWNQEVHVASGGVGNTELTNQVEGLFVFILI